MANPQPDYFVRISQELYAQLNRVDIGATERPVLDHVIGETYGHDRKMAAFTWADIARAINKKRQAVERAGRSLLDRALLVQDFAPGGAMLLGPQKDYDKWQARATKATGKATGKATQKATGKARCLSNGESNTVLPIIPYNKNLKAKTTPDAFGFTHDPTAARAYADPMAAALAGVNPEYHPRWDRLAVEERDSVADVYLDHWRPVLASDTAAMPAPALDHLVGVLKSAAGGMPSYLSSEIGVYLAGALDRWREEQERRDEQRRKAERDGEAKE